MELFLFDFYLTYLPYVTQFQIWSFIFTTSDSVISSELESNLTSRTSQSNNSIEFDSQLPLNKESKFFDDHNYDEADTNSEAKTTSSFEGEQFSAELRDIPGVISRPPTLITRRHIDIDNPKFQYMWSGTKPTGFRKSNRKMIQDNIQDIINNLSDDEDHQTESSHAVSRKAYKISGIYKIPKIRKKYEETNFGVLRADDQQDRYISPLYTLRTVSPLEVNWMATRSSQPFVLQNVHLDRMNTQIGSPINYDLRHVYQNKQNVRSFLGADQTKPKVPMRLMLDIIPEPDDQEFRSIKSGNLVPKVQNYQNINGVIPYTARSAQQQPQVTGYQFHNINQNQLYHRLQNDYYNMYYKNKYFQKNQAQNYGRPYYIKVPKENKIAEPMKGNRMVIHLDLIPEEKN